MTVEHINQIAEEYADMYMDLNIPLISKKDNIRNTFIREAKTVLSILSERYYIVEKDKVDEEYNKLFNRFYSGDIKYLTGRRDELTTLFHPTIVNKV